MQETDAQFLTRMKSTRGFPLWSDVERIKRIEREKRAQRFAEILRRPR